MALAASNHCANGHTFDIGLAICPYCFLTATNYTSGGVIDTSSVQFSGGENPLQSFLTSPMNGIHTFDWASDIHHILGPVNSAILGSKYMKIRITAWEGGGLDFEPKSNEEFTAHTVRAITFENRGGYGAGAFGPIRGISNFWSKGLSLARGSRSKALGAMQARWGTEDTTIVAFEQSWVRDWIGHIEGSRLVFDEASKMMVRKTDGCYLTHHKILVEKRVTRAECDHLYDMFGMWPEVVVGHDHHGRGGMGKYGSGFSRPMELD